MEITINRDDGTPYYAQIVNQVKELIADGTLQPDQELDSVRILSGKLDVTPNTVVRAYQELERERLVVKRTTLGTFVSAEAGTLLSRRVGLKLLKKTLRQALLDARRYKISPKDVQELLRECVDELEAEKRPSR